MDACSNELTRPMIRIQARLGRSLATEIEERYNTRGETLAEIGEALGVSASTVSRYMSRLGIEARFPGQRAKAS